jgi:predicted enzyme related to lactoylglutathione lyase
MGSRWRGVVVVATDPARLSRWWAEVLGYRILDERHDGIDVGPGEGSPLLTFAPATVAPPGPSRVHLDISVDDRDAELERLVDMGARPVEGGAAGRVVLVDPEGNEFSLLLADPVIAPTA